MEKELSSIDVIHNEIQLVRSLEGVVEINEERMAELLQNALLGAGVFEFVSLNNGLLVEDLHGVDLFSVFLSDLHDLSKASLSDDAKNVKVIDSHSVRIRGSASPVGGRGGAARRLTGVCGRS